MRKKAKLFESDFAGKKPFLHLVLSKIKLVVGAFYPMQQIDFSNVDRLVFVCKGNISRSPFACLYTRVKGVNSASFGLDATTGSTADPVAKEVAKIRGVDLTSHRATHIDDFKFTPNDLILCFEPAQVYRIKSILSGRGIPVSLVGLWSEKKRPYIADPYGIDPSYYHTCYQVTESSILKLISMLPDKCNLDED